MGADKVWKPQEAEGKDNLLLHTRDTERFPRSGQTVINEQMKLQSWRYALRESAALASACLSGSHSAHSQGRKNRHRVTRASHLRLLSELQQKTRRIEPKNCAEKHLRTQKRKPRAKKKGDWRLHESNTRPFAN